MNTNQGALYFGAGIDMAEWRKNVAEMRRDILGLNRETQQETSKIDEAFRNLSLSIGAYFSVNALQGFVQQLIQVRGEFQKTEIAFGTMLKSEEKAKELMGQMVDLAAKTPFSLQEVSEGAKRLLAFQVPANEVVETLRRMGDVAAGLGVPMGQLIHVYGQVKAQGKLMTNDLYQFMNAGIPILAELGKIMGKTEAEVKQMVGEGKVGFTEIQQVIQNLTNEGGLFFNLMEKQSASLSGQIANLEDAIAQMFNKIGESSEGFLSGGIQGLTFLVENYEKVGAILTTLVATYGAYRTAVMATMVVENIRGRMLVQQALSQTALSSAQAFGAVVTMNLQRAMAMLNATMSINPFVATATAVVALVAVLWNLETAADSVQDKMKDIDDETKKHKSEAEGLIDIIKSETATYLEKADALVKLQSLAPETFANLTQEQIMAMDLTEAHRLLNEEIERGSQRQKRQTLEQMKEELASLQRLKDFNVEDHTGHISGRIAELKQGIAELEFAEKQRAEALMAQNEPLEKQLEYWEEEEKKINEAIDAIKRKHPELDITKAKAGELAPEIAKMQTSIDGLSFKGLIDRFNQVRNMIRSVKNELSPVQNVPDKPLKDMNKTELENKKKNLNEKKGDLTVNEIREGKGKVFDKELSEINKALEVYNTQTERATKNTNKLTKSQKGTKNPTANLPVKGSLGALERELSAVIDRLQNKTLTTDKDTVKKLLAQRTALEKKIAEIRERYQKKSFEEEIEETKRQIEVRDKLLQNGYSQETVNEMFPKVKDKSYLEFLEKTKEALETQKAQGDKSIETAENLVKIQEKIREYKGEKTFIEGVIKNIEKLKEEFSGEELIQKLEGLKRLDTNETEEETRLKNIEVAKAIEEEKRQMKGAYDQFLKEHQDFEAKKLEITKQYNALRQQAQKDLEEGKISETQYRNIIVKIDREESDKVTDLFLEDLQKDDKWVDVFQRMENTATIRLQALRQKLVEQLKNIKSEAEALKIKVHIENIDQQLDKRKGIFGGIKDIISKAKNYKQAKAEMKQANKEFAQSLEGTGADSERTAAAYEKMDKKAQEFENTQVSLSDALGNTGGDMIAFANTGMEAIQGVKGICEDLGVSLDNEFGDVLEKMQGVMQGIGQVGEGLTHIASGNVVGGAIKVIGGVVKAVSSFFNDDKRKERNIKKWAQAVEHLKEAYKDLEHQLKKTLGEGVYKQQGAMIANLRQQQANLYRMANEESGKKKADHDKINQWRNQANDINRQIDDIITGMHKDIAQTDAKTLADQLGDALFEAWSKGEDGAEAYGRTVDEVMRTAAKNALKQRLLQEPMQRLIDDMVIKMGYGDANIDRQIQEAEQRINAIKESFKKGSVKDFFKGTEEITALQTQIQTLKDKQKLNFEGSFDGLTDEERREIKEKGENAMHQYMNALKQYESLFGGAVENADSLKGSIKGMSEQAVDVSVGQFNAIRINTAEILKNSVFSVEAMKNAVGVLTKIEQNTFNLYQIKKDISEMNSKMSSSSSGLRASGN